MGVLAVSVLTLMVSWSGLLSPAGPSLVSAEPDPQTALQKVLAALDKGLDFYQQEYTRLNLDAVIGTRLVEGQLSVLLKHLKQPNGPQLSAEVVEKVQNLRDKADHVSNIATPVVEQTQPNYYSRIGAVLRPGFWTLDYGSRDVNRGLIRRPGYDGEAMHEDDSDDCLTELLGTGEHTPEQCQISRKCWNLMTESGYKGYSLSHEIFYLEIGQQSGCFKSDMNHILGELHSDFCANMYAEARHIARSGFPVEDRDLFMELPALCGVLGYRQFFRDDWLERILSWQWPKGCWGTTDQPKPRAVKDRFKREEKRFSDGCMCHRTAVALGALTQYTRYIIEYISNRPPIH